MEDKIAKEPVKCQMLTGNAIIDLVMPFECLGVYTINCRNLIEETQIQNTKLLRTAYCLRDVIFRNNYMRLQGKIRIYTRMMYSIITYAYETRAETKKTKLKMRTTEINTKLDDSWTSQQERCNIQLVAKWRKNVEKEMGEHIERMDDINGEEYYADPPKKVGLDLILFINKMRQGKQGIS